MTSDGRTQAPPADPTRAGKAPTDPPIVSEGPTPEEVEKAKKKDSSE
jgi:hypothetical protein